MNGLLYHFTCEHSMRSLGRGPNAVLVPHFHPLLEAKLLWLTTQPEPDREKTGLGQHIAKCDRMAFRYVVSDLRKCRAWLTSIERARTAKTDLYDLETDGDPEHWWIASEPVVARFDRTWNGIAA